MTDVQTDSEKTAATKASPEYKNLLAMVMADLGPTIDVAAKAAVSAASPAAAVIVDPVIDAVDAWINKLLGVSVPATAKKASTETADRLTALEQHVAALTVSTGAATSSAMQAAKVQAATIAANEPKENAAS
jgi:hypothetical protein